MTLHTPTLRAPVAREHKKSFFRLLKSLTPQVRSFGRDERNANFTGKDMTDIIAPLLTVAMGHNSLRDDYTRLCIELLQKNVDPYTVDKDLLRAKEFKLP
eukprot:2721743-Pleurochrysis_carterae.AAC.1